MKLVFFMRKKTTGWSVERVFADIATELSGSIAWEFHRNRFISRGIFGRMADIALAALNQGEINHVTGDVHYLTFGLRKNRTILTILDCVFMRESNKIKRALYWLFWLWLPIRRAAVITTISEASRKEILKWRGCGAAKVVVIHAPVSSLYKPKPKAFNKSRPRILHIGTAPHKNLERHIKALEEIPAELIIVGRIGHERLQQLKKEPLPITVLTGLTDAEMYEQYQMADLILFASTYEGFGLPIVEAQSVGRPVVTSNISSMPEVAGEGACLVNPFEVESIRSAIIRIIHDDDYRNLLVQNGYANAKRFDAKRIAKQYEELYRELREKCY
jgi:glycosyltransferase involved in cell wall biosynthesis